MQLLGNLSSDIMLAIGLFGDFLKITFSRQAFILII